MTDNSCVKTLEELNFVTSDASVSSQIQPVLTSLTQEYVKMKNLEKITSVPKVFKDPRLKPLEKLVVVRRDDKVDLEPLWAQLELQTAAAFSHLSKEIGRMTDADVKVLQKTISHLS